jgi:plasmid stability protein
LIKIEGSEQLKLHSRSFCEEFREIFRQEVKPSPARVTPITFDVDKVKWGRPVNLRQARLVSVTVRNEIKRQIG